MSDRIRTAPDTRFTHAGIGMSTSWLCLGCKQRRPQLGSRGRGLAKRCGVCLQARTERRESFAENAEAINA